MPVLLRAKTYKWLKSIHIFRNEPLPSTTPQLCEVPYDQQIYLKNGYLIGAIIRKFVTPYSQSYTELLGVRKIAILKSSQNWPFLTRIGCSILKHPTQQPTQYKIQSSQLAEIVEALFDEFSPKQKQKKLALIKKTKSNYIDFYNFNANQNINECQNSLELFCILLVRILGISLNQALGLLINRFKYFKILVVEGSLKDEFESVKKLYEQITNAWPTIQQLTASNPSDLSKLLQGLSQGVLSENPAIINLTLNLLSYVKQQEWFIKYGYYKILSSSYIECFYFTIERLSPHYQFILNQKIHINIPNKQQFFIILLNLAKILPKTIYCKEVMNHMPIQYFYQQCYKILNPDILDQQPPFLVIISKELIARLMINFTSKIPTFYATKILQIFKFNTNRSNWDIYHTLVLLFELLENFINKQSFLTQKIFKLVLKYFNCTYGQNKHWIIENIKFLYNKLGKSFPLLLLLQNYSPDEIAQADQYSLFDEIANNNNQLCKEEVTQALTYLTSYVQSQVHCHCFMNIINKFLLNHTKMSVNWGEYSSLKLLQKMNIIKIPILSDQTYILNPVPPSKNKLINAIGLKRKQMLKYKQYQQCKQLLQSLIKINDKNFLNFYVNSLNHTIHAIQKQIGHKKKQLLNLYKDIRNRCKKSISQINQSQPMSQLVKNIMLNKTMQQKTDRQKTNQFYFYDNNQIVTDNHQSRLIGSRQSLNSPVQEKFDQGNQAITGNFYNSNKNIRITSSKGIEKQDSLLPLQNMLLPFTQQQIQNQEQFFIYDAKTLEQNQIIYINMMKQKYFNIFSHCTTIYTRLDARLAENSQIIKLFLKQIKLDHIIDNNIALSIINHLQNYNHNHREFVENLIVQIAFHVFGFKKNMRINVLCVSSLLTILQQNLRDVLQSSKTSNSKKKQQKSQNIFTTDIKFQYKLSTRILPSQLHKQSYMLCFYVLSQIFNNIFTINLIEPLSQMVNIIPKSISNSQLSFKQPQLFENIEQNEDEIEMRYLQQKLQQQKIKQLQNNKITLHTNILSKQKPIYSHISTINFGQFSNSLKNKIINNNQLKNKLNNRIKILGQQVNLINKQKNKQTIKQTLIQLPYK